MSIASRVTEIVPTKRARMPYCSRTADDAADRTGEELDEIELSGEHRGRFAKDKQEYREDEEDRTPTTKPNQPLHDGLGPVGRDVDELAEPDGSGTLGLGGWTGTTHARLLLRTRPVGVSEGKGTSSNLWRRRSRKPFVRQVLVRPPCRGIAGSGGHIAEVENHLLAFAMIQAKYSATAAGLADGVDLQRPAQGIRAVGDVVNGWRNSRLPLRLRP